MTDTPHGRLARRDRPGPALAATRRRHRRARGGELRPRTHHGRSSRWCSTTKGDDETLIGLNAGTYFIAGVRGSPRSPRGVLRARGPALLLLASILATAVLLALLRAFPDVWAVVSAPVRARDGGELPVDSGQRRVRDARGHVLHRFVHLAVRRRRRSGPVSAGTRCPSR